MLQQGRGGGISRGRAGRVACHLLLGKRRSCENEGRREVPARLPDNFLPLFRWEPTCTNLCVCASSPGDE